VTDPLRFAAPRSAPDPRQSADATNVVQPMPPTRSAEFAVAGAGAVAITALTVPFHLLGWLPFVGDLLERGGAAGTIAALILAALLWVVLFVLLRGAYVLQQREAVRAGRFLPQEQTLIGRRMALLRRMPKDSLNALEHNAILATRSELDHAHSDVAYGAARALVWAMPALGFLGTAAEMSTAVRGLGTSVGKGQDYLALKNALVSEVVPHLAQAFSATLFALGASVVCHLLLTWTNLREQRLLLEVEEATLRRVAEQRPSPPLTLGTPGLETRRLNGEIRQLAQEVQDAGRALRDFTVRLNELDAAEVRTRLDQVNANLQQIHTTLGKPLVLSRLTEV